MKVQLLLSDSEMEEEYLVFEDEARRLRRLCYLYEGSPKLRQTIALRPVEHKALMDEIRVRKRNKHYGIEFDANSSVTWFFEKTKNGKRRNRQPLLRDHWSRESRLVRKQLRLQGRLVDAKYLIAMYAQIKKDTEHKFREFDEQASRMGIESETEDEMEIVPLRAMER